MAGVQMRPTTDRALLEALRVDVDQWHATHYEAWQAMLANLRDAVERDDVDQANTLVGVVLPLVARKVNQWAPLLDEIHEKLGAATA